MKSVNVSRVLGLVFVGLMGFSGLSLYSSNANATTVMDYLRDLQERDRQHKIQCQASDGEFINGYCCTPNPYDRNGHCVECKAGQDCFL